VPSEFDDRDYPLIRIRALGESRDEDILERLAFLERHLARPGKLALVFDTTGSKPIGARQRKMWTDWLTRHDARLRRNVAGVAMVVTSALMRGVFTGIFWVWQPPMPYAFTATAREADAWARARLGALTRPG
jgi:hypothetical protein